MCRTRGGFASTARQRCGKLELMGTALSETERVRRKRWASDQRAAAALGMSPDDCLAARAATIKTLTTMIRAAMDEHGASDPVEVLPEILARMQEKVVAEARVAAKAAAREEVQRLLRKAIA